MIYNAPAKPLTFTLLYGSSDKLGTCIASETSEKKNEKPSIEAEGEGVVVINGEQKWWTCAFRRKP